jgi:hypothetical protein
MEASGLPDGWIFFGAFQHASYEPLVAARLLQFVRKPAHIMIFFAFPKNIHEISGLVFFR